MRHAWEKYGLIVVGNMIFFVLLYMFVYRPQMNDQTAQALYEGALELEQSAPNEAILLYSLLIKKHPESGYRGKAKQRIASLELSKLGPTVPSSADIPPSSIKSSTEKPVFDYEKNKAYLDAVYNIVSSAQKGWLPGTGIGEMARSAWDGTEHWQLWERYKGDFERLNTEYVDPDLAALVKEYIVTYDEYFRFVSHIRKGDKSTTDLKGNVKGNVSVLGNGVGGGVGGGISESKEKLRKTHLDMTPEVIEKEKTLNEKRLKSKTLLDEYRNVFLREYKTAKARLDEAQRLFSIRQYKESRAIFETLSVIFPEDAEMLYAFGISLWKTGNLDNAEDMLTKAIEQGNDENGRCMQARAAVRTDARKYPQAMADITALTEQNPQTRLLLLRCKAGLSQKDEAFYDTLRTCLYDDRLAFSDIAQCAELAAYVRESAKTLNLDLRIEADWSSHNLYVINKNTFSWKKLAVLIECEQDEQKAVLATTAPELAVDTERYVDDWKADLDKEYLLTVTLICEQGIKQIKIQGPIKKEK